eukprot:CAMPEP_0172839898 /NCGR_PEP_ID=MMETSP1075-20121228/28908_1 /TAXON_ID=2916 /ORGANISM="Ceratium fusus, Strain PA161109" /LENGTH=72 /DNA_ID=CAMNT_0013683627 /DNA_START=15 /DNA_END=231 /DNA_ORIENTATION=-
MDGQALLDQKLAVSWAFAKPSRNVVAEGYGLNEYETRQVAEAAILCMDSKALHDQKLGDSWAIAKPPVNGVA